MPAPAGIFLFASALHCHLILCNA